MAGKINLIMGCMFSGKTTELLARYSKYIIAGKKCIMIKRSFDKRYDETCVVTHDGKKVNAIATDLLADLDKIIKEYDVICIDEIQFFTDANAVCEKWANEYGKIIEASGLNGDYERHAFSVISNLIPCCDSIIFKKAVCRETGKAAAFTFRKIESKEQFVIGGEKEYEAVDRVTYLLKNKK